MNKKVKNFIIGALSLTAYLLLLYIFTDNLCLFKITTGFPCPGCGLTRAYISLFKGNIAVAFFYHPMFFTVPIVAFIFYKNKGNIFANKKSTVIMWIILIAFFATYIIRMILLFPNTPPMDYENKSLLNIIFRIFK